MLIKNDDQRQVVFEHLAGFKRALESLNDPAQPDRQEQWLVETNQASLHNFIIEYEAALSDYDQLKVENQLTFPAHSIGELAASLIKARIAEGLTEADLAARVGISTEQIMDFEETDHDSTPLGYLMLIAEALNLKLYADLTRPGEEAVHTANGNPNVLLRQHQQLPSLPRTLSSSVPTSRSQTSRRPHRQATRSKANTNEE